MVDCLLYFVSRLSTKYNLHKTTGKRQSTIPFQQTSNFIQSWYKRQLTAYKTNKYQPMTTEEKEQLIHSLKREAITLPAEGLTTLSYDIEDIYKIIPHRPPFALVKSLVAVNLEKGKC